MISMILMSIDDDKQRSDVEQIWNLYGKIMLAKAFGILGNMQDAEDAVQEAFLRISKNAENFSEPKSPDTIALVSIYTRNVAINMYRRNKKRNELFGNDGDLDNVISAAAESEDIAQLIVNDETVEIVRRAINMLDEPYKDVILLKYYYHKKNIEIAEVLGVDANTVNGRVFRAKKKLKELIGEEGYARLSNK